jgi:hypothetical protein
VIIYDVLDSGERQHAWPRHGSSGHPVMRPAELSGDDVSLDRREVGGLRADSLLRLLCGCVEAW